MKASFLPLIQHRTSRVAVSASAARGQGAPGLVLAAREFLAAVPLSQFSVSDAAKFRRRLDRTTRELVESMPRRARKWGVARKLLNIFLRDALYTSYLADAFRLQRIESFLEVPLDSITARCIRADSPRGTTPRWFGVRNLTMADSDRFQASATTLARPYRVARVHLDAMWWGARATD